MVDSGLYKVCDYAGYLIVVDNDISVHCSFSESGPIVGNFHRALVSRLSSGHRCLSVIVFQLLPELFFSGLFVFMFLIGFFLNCVLFRFYVVMFM